MTVKKVMVCDTIHEKGIELLSNEEDIEVFNGANLPKDELLKVIGEYDIAITRSSTPVNKAFLESAKNLKAIVRAGVGVDNVDMDGCSKRGIIVMNVPTANTIAAVEMTMAHLLATARSFPNANNDLKLDRIWKREKWYGIELFGKKLGIIGFGNIGSRVATRAKAFGMDVVAYDPYIDPKKAIDLGVEYSENFDDILSCDFITIHTPKNKETINIISYDEISKMKDGVRLVNCARGGLYNEDALYDGLKSGKIAYLGIDVFLKEPAINNKLLDLDNVSVTPHLGANTHESQEKIATQAASQAISAARGSSFPNALNLPIDETKIPSFVKPYLELMQKMASFVAQVNKASIGTIKIVTEGEISDYIDSLMTFAIVGALKESMGAQINYVNAEFIAEEKDIKLIKEKFSGKSAFKNSIDLYITTNKGTSEIKGTAFGDNIQRIVKFDGFDLDIEPKGKMIIFKNTDVPGVIGEIGTILAKNDINIADFRLGRDDKGHALSAILVDNNVNKKVLQELKELPTCLGVAYTVL